MSESKIAPEVGVVAVNTFDLILPDGTLSPVTISVGKPYEENPDLWLCHTTIDGSFGSEKADIGGVDSFQALLLALKFIGLRLADLEMKTCGKFVRTGVDMLGLDMV